MKELRNVENSQAADANSDSPEVDKPATTKPLRVLMVCTGNICRSTMAEQVLREAVERAGAGTFVEVDSAGITNWERGNPIDSRAAQVLAEAGYQVPTHRARQATSAEMGRWDLVLGMTSEHVHALKQLAAAGGVDVHDRLNFTTPNEQAPTNMSASGAGFAFESKVNVDDASGSASQLVDTTVPGALTVSTPAGGSASVTIQRFRDFDPQGKGDVPDPWYGTRQDFVDTLAVIERVTPVLLDRLRAARR